MILLSILGLCYVTEPFLCESFLQPDSEFSSGDEAKEIDGVWALQSSSDPINSMQAED